MSQYAYYFYLIGKYFLVAHIFDMGYSKSRDHRDIGRNTALLYHAFFQTAATGWIIRSFSIRTIVGTIVMEALFLTICSLIDRHISVFYAVRTFFIMEACMLLGYGLLGYRLYH